MICYFFVIVSSHTVKEPLPSAYLRILAVTSIFIKLPAIVLSMTNYNVSTFNLNINVCHDQASDRQNCSFLCLIILLYMMLIVKLQTKGRYNSRNDDSYNNHNTVHIRCKKAPFQ